MLVTRKIPISYTESRREGSVCCQQVSQVSQGEGVHVWTAFVVRELHLSYREWIIGRMEGVSGSYPSVTRRHGMEEVCHKEVSHAVWVSRARVLQLL